MSKGRATMNIDTLNFVPGNIEDAMPDADCAELLAQLPGWHIESNGHNALIGSFRFDNFAGAMSFANRVADVAESFDHHPELTVTWGRATVKWWTHTAGGISVNDFVLARETHKLSASDPGSRDEN